MVRRTWPTSELDYLCDQIVTGLLTLMSFDWVHWLLRQVCIFNYYDAITHYIIIAKFKFHQHLSALCGGKIAKCEKGPLWGKVSMLVQAKTCAKPPVHAIVIYCIIETYGVSPVFRPRLKPVLHSSVSNKDRILLLPQSFCSCTEYTGNDNTGGRPNFKYIHLLKASWCLLNGVDSEALNDVHVIKFILA